MRVAQFACPAATFDAVDFGAVELARMMKIGGAPHAVLTARRRPDASTLSSLTQYDTIDLLWFDGEWERSGQEWHAAGLQVLVPGPSDALTDVIAVKLESS